MRSCWKKSILFFLTGAVLSGLCPLPGGFRAGKDVRAQELLGTVEAVYAGDDVLADEPEGAEEAGEIPYVMPSMEEMEAYIAAKYGGFPKEEAVPALELSAEDPAELIFPEEEPLPGETVFEAPGFEEPVWPEAADAPVFQEEPEAADAPVFQEEPEAADILSEDFFDSEEGAENPENFLEEPYVPADAPVGDSGTEEPSLFFEDNFEDTFEPLESFHFENSLEEVPPEPFEAVFSKPGLIWEDESASADGLIFTDEDAQEENEAFDFGWTDQEIILFGSGTEDISPDTETAAEPLPGDFLTMVVQDDGLAGSQGIDPSGHYTLEVADGDDITIPLNYLIQSVKDTASDDHPVTIVIPSGNYDLTGTISLYSNMTLIAEGAVITKRNPVKQILMRFGLENESGAGGYNSFRNIVIDGGTWDLNYPVISDALKQESGGYVGFRLGHVTNLTVQNVHFRNNLKSHFLELGGAKDVLVTGCSFSGYWEGYIKGGQECIQLDACLDYILPGCLPYDGTTCEQIVIENNTFSHVFAGVGAHSMVFGVPYRDIRIRNNTFTDVKKRSVWCMNFTDSVVEGNTMDDVGGGVDVDSGHSTNVHVLPGTAASSPHTLHTGLVIQNNQITLGEQRILVNFDGQTSTWNPYGIRITGFKYTTANEVHEAGLFPVADVKVLHNTISGSAGGILLSLAENCTITDNTLDLFFPDTFKNIGISLTNSKNNTVNSNRVSDAKGNGIYLYTSSTGNVIQSNRVERSGGCGICLASSSGNNRILSNTVTDNGSDGIQITGCSKVTLQKNSLTSNGRHGLYLNSAKSCTLSGGKAVYNQGRGISLNKSVSNTISQVSVKGNVNGGIGLYTSSTSNKLTGNTVSGNDGDGIVLSSSGSNILTSNNASKNERYGIYLYQSKSLKLTSNRADSNSAAGFYVRGSRLTAFSKNTAYYNKTYGIAGNSSAFAGVSGNKTYSNGKAAQIYMYKCSGMATMNKPVSSKVTGSTTVFKGKAVGAMYIALYKQVNNKNTKLMSGKVSKSIYSIKGKKLKKGTKLLLLAKDKYGNESRALYTVK